MEWVAEGRGRGRRAVQDMMVKVLPAQGTRALSGPLVTIRQVFIYLIFFLKSVTHCLLSSPAVIVSETVSIGTTRHVLFKVVPGIERKLSRVLWWGAVY